MFIPLGCCKVPICRSRYKSKSKLHTEHCFAKTSLKLQVPAGRWTPPMPGLITILSTQHIRLQLRWPILSPILRHSNSSIFRSIFISQPMWHISAAGADSSVRELASGGLLGGRRTSKHGQRLCLPGTRFGQPLINFSARFKNLYLSWE